METLTTGRLRLREAMARDFAFLAGLMNETGYWAAVGDQGVRTASDAEHYVRSAEIYRYGSGLGFNLVETLDHECPLGICGLVRRKNTGAIELGYGFVARAAGKGIATEAARAVVQHAFNRLEAGRLMAVTSDDNLASRRVLEKLGMAFERRNADGERIYLLTRTMWSSQ